MDDLKLYGKNQTEIEELIRATQEFSTDICMEFGIAKCATLKMKEGRRVKGIGVKLPTGEVLQDLEEEGYRIQIPRHPRSRHHPTHKDEDRSNSRVPQKTKEDPKVWSPRKELL